ncbi:MAG TPA: VOC family protein [Pseudonocardiaceae bacterium]|nr:VOC family protein [Pseudonocardiaceae bacterium]
MTGIFGNVRLGYLVIETNRFADWRRFGVDAIGMRADDLDTGTLRFRLDDHECRFLLRRGPAEDVTAVGWQLTDHDTFDEVIRRVRAHGVPAIEAPADDALARGVERLLRFPGPKGLVHEIFTSTRLVPQSARPSQFVTGPGGLGHIALTTTEPAKLRAYYDTVFDARLTDYIDETISGVKLKVRFLRVNERHHSVALAATQRLRVDPIRTRIQHVNVQVADLDHLLAAYQRVTDLGFRMALSVGQHTNDRELSFYARSPSGFEWEVGWNPITIDESTWQPAAHTGISIWGHTPIGQTVIDKLEQFARGARSLTRAEETVPALSSGND